MFLYLDTDFFSSHYARTTTTHFLFLDSQVFSKLHKFSLIYALMCMKYQSIGVTFTTLAHRSSFKITKFLVLLLMTLQSWTLSKKKKKTLQSWNLCTRVLRWLKYYFSNTHQRQVIVTFLHLGFCMEPTFGSLLKHVAVKNFAPTATAIKILLWYSSYVNRRSV